MNYLRITPFIILMIFLSEDIHSQVVLTDGSKVDYKKIHFEKSELEIIQNDKNKLKIPVTKVVAIQRSIEDFEYHLPVPDYNNTREYDFIARKFEGKINLYERITDVPTYGGPAGPYGNVFSGSKKDIDIYFEKDGIVKQIKHKGLLKGKRNLRADSLKFFLSDCPETNTLLNNDDYKLDYDNLIDLVRIYNLYWFKYEKYANSQLANVYFYSGFTGDRKPEINLTVNDTLTFKIPPTGTVLVPLQTLNLSKVCVTIANVTYCNLLRGADHYVKYFEIDWKKVKGQINIEKQYKSDADFRIKQIYMRYNQN